MKVYNRCKQVVEKAEWVQCPCCKGFGNTFSIALVDQECICKGFGSLWQGKTYREYYRAKHQRLERSVCY